MHTMPSTMPTNANVNDGSDHRAPSVRTSSAAAEIGREDFAPDAAMETHGGATSTHARKLTKLGRDLLGHHTEAGYDDDDGPGGEMGIASTKNDGDMEQVEGRNGYEAPTDSVAIDSVDYAVENGKKSSADVTASLDGADMKTGDDDNVAQQTTDTSKQTKSSMELDDGDEIGRSHRHEPFLPDTRSSIATEPTSFRHQKQDKFVKKGARIRALLTTALRSVADGFAFNNTEGNKKDENESVRSFGRERDVDNNNDRRRKTWNARTDFAHIQDLAQKKAEECMSLKMKLQESQSQIEVFRNENSSSREANTQLTAKIDRTLEALQIAGVNAANARAEADASNARTESLSGQLNDLRSVIEETKRGMEVVRREHDEVSRGARSVEGRLIQVEGELTRAARARKEAVGERDFLKSRAEKAENLARALQGKMDDYYNEVSMLKKDLLEIGELEKARSDRTSRIESDFQEARSGLLEATSAAAEAESTITSLRSVIEELRQENESLHEQMNESRDIISKDRVKQNESLALAEREAQKWKMKCEEFDEEARKMKMDKIAAEKQVGQLKSRVANMECRLNDSNKQFRTEKLQTASSVVTPHSSNNLGFINAFGTKGASAVFEEPRKRKYVAELPQRLSSEAAPNSASRQSINSYQKANKSNVNEQDELQKNVTLYGGLKKKRARNNKCCLCSKEGGMILSCQCGKIDCDMRAHAICIGKFKIGGDNPKRPILCGQN